MGEMCGGGERDQCRPHHCHYSSMEFLGGRGQLFGAIPWVMLLFTGSHSEKGQSKVFCMETGRMFAGRPVLPDTLKYGLAHRISWGKEGKRGNMDFTTEVRLHDACGPSCEEILRLPRKDGEAPSRREG